MDERMEKLATERERDYQWALETLYGNTTASADLSKEERDDLYRDAMRLLHEKYPEDDEAATMYALSILGSAHEGRDYTTYMQAAAVALTVWEKNKMHPGAAHFLIHSFDDPVHAPLGLPMANAYSKIAPAAAHAQHMTSHIFVALGMWDETVGANEIAIAVTNTRRAELERPPNVCGHYTFWLHYGYLQLDRQEDARAVLDACQERINGEPTVSESGYFASMRARHVIDTGQWEDAATLTASYDAGKWGAGTYSFISALAAAKMNDADAAGEHIETMWLKTDEDATETVTIYEKQVQAVLALNRGEPDEGIALLQEIVDLEAALPMEFGPPRPALPANEALGEALLDLDRFSKAAKAFQAQLSRTPNRAAALQGLTRARSGLTEAG